MTAELSSAPAPVWPAPAAAGLAAVTVVPVPPALSPSAQLNMITGERGAGAGAAQPGRDRWPWQAGVRGAWYS
jgi:hypothetical protein